MDDIRIVPFHKNTVVKDNICMATIWLISFAIFLGPFIYEGHIELTTRLILTVISVYALLIIIPISVQIKKYDEEYTREIVITTDTIEILFFKQSKFLRSEVIQKSEIESFKLTAKLNSKHVSSLNLVLPIESCNTVQSYRKIPWHTLKFEIKTVSKNISFMYNPTLVYFWSASELKQSENILIALSSLQNAINNFDYDISGNDIKTRKKLYKYYPPKGENLI